MGEFKNNNELNDEPIRLGFKDVLAMTIAAIEVLLPIALLFAGIMGIVFFILLKFWIK
ncbi:MULTISPECIES: hypothetical protein [Caloramator]|uniref:Uncharacterized protein n=1 Tax=Caloramator proteoclasticus DSM 10124 TaxID=1121262 RepID=A0A1M4VTW6_9CLOT|nr:MULTISPECIES: hypothetical protein [Caloramator]SHE72253.1 hypothetical protein SAMN02746091_00982 [Caloramator proteoclasticus DSM 10124]